MVTKCVMIDSSFHQSFVDITFIKTFLRLLSERYCRAEDNQIIVMIVLPWRLSKTIPTLSVVCDLFLRKGGTILCMVTGPHQYSRDLEKVGSM